MDRLTFAGLVLLAMILGGGAGYAGESGYVWMLVSMLILGAAGVFRAKTIGVSGVIGALCFLPVIGWGILVWFFCRSGKELKD